MSILRLGEICSKIGSGATPKGGKNVYTDEGTALIRSQNVHNLDFVWDGLARITEEAANKLSSVTVEADDVLLNITGDSVARVCLAPIHVLPARVNQHVAIIRPDSTILNPHFLALYLASPYMQSCMFNRAAGKGASRNAITKDMIASFEVPVPSLSEQEHIVSRLSAYDSLIENNRKQIKLLEEVAQRLYREWFINLRFPGHETTQIDSKSKTPLGWTTKTIEQLCLRIQSGSTPSRNNSNYWNSAEHDWFKTAELEDHWLINSEEGISSEALEGTSVKKFPANSILMAIYASPTLGRLGLLSKEATFNQAALGFIVDERIVSKEWLFQKLYELRPEFNSIARGAGQQNISGQIVKNYEVTLPTYDLIVEYTKIVRPLYRKMLKIQTQNIVLTEARARLLPKLMSDEIEV